MLKLARCQVMKWVRHYRKKDSAASAVLKRINNDKLTKKSKKKDRSLDKHKLPEPDGTELSELPLEQQFLLCNGTRLKNINELALTLDSISEEDFSAHVNEEKNDFGNWVRDVFKEETLANELQQASDRKEFQIALLKHVVGRRGE